VLNVATKGTIAVYETMGTQIDLSMLHGSETQMGILISISGLVGVTILVNFHHFTTIFSEIELIVGGMVLMAIMCLLLGLLLKSPVFGIPSFYISIIAMYSIAYPIGHTAVLGMFSKLIVDGPQGQMLGWFASAGSVARVVFPLAAGLISNFYDDSVIFLVMFLTLLMGIFITLLYKAKIEVMLKDSM